MNHSNTLVSVVIVNYKNTPLLLNCLSSLVNQSYKPLEIIVVDNGSEDHVGEIISSQYPDVRLICLEKNLGFSGGNNRGFAAAKGRYIAIINNDAVASENWIDSLVKVMQREDSIGSVGSIIIDGNDPSVLDSMGVGVYLDGMSRQVKKGCVVKNISVPEEILLPSGCACLYRRSALDDVGFFDELFFAYCEDTDLGLRLRRAGWTSCVAPGAKVTHFYSKTFGEFSLRKIFWIERNHYWVVIKNFPFILIVLLPFFTIWRQIIQFSYLLNKKRAIEGFVSKSGMMRVIFTIIFAQLSALIGAPHFLLQRIFASKTKKTVSSWEMLKLILKYKLSLKQILGELS